MSIKLSKPRCPITGRKPSAGKKRIKLNYKEMITRNRKSEKTPFDSLSIYDSVSLKVRLTPASLLEFSSKSVNSPVLF